MSSKPESRLSIHEVPEKISRIFFGDPSPHASPPKYQNDYPNYANSYGSRNILSPSEIQTLYSAGLTALILAMILCLVSLILMIGWTCYLCCCRRSHRIRSDGNRINEEKPLYNPDNEKPTPPSSPKAALPIYSHKDDELPTPPPTNTSSEISNPRSLPYYEVPSNQVLPVRTTRFGQLERASPVMENRFRDREQSTSSLAGKMV